jgi:hypothetical protein
MVAVSTSDRPQDPLLAKRARIARWCDVGKRLGYGAYGLAVVLFFVGFAVGFRTWITTTIVLLMVGGGVVLAPAIVFAYGVKAADREDRESQADGTT